MRPEAPMASCQNDREAGGTVDRQVEREVGSTYGKLAGGKVG